MHYKSRLVDYSALGSGAGNFACDQDGVYPGELSIAVDGPIPDHIVSIAHGYESGGRHLLLDVRNDQIIEGQIRCGSVGKFDVVEWFETMKEAYRSLKLIPCLGYETLEVGHVEERPASEGDISEEEVRAQKYAWTDLDAQHVRQVYRKYGWPEDFRREEAKKYIDELMESMDQVEGRFRWIRAFH